MSSVVQAQGYGDTAKNLLARLLGSVVIQFYVSECLPSIDRRKTEHGITEAN